MMYAVIQTGGKQYQVFEGREILVDSLSLADGSPYEFADVLLVRTDEKIFVGDPRVKDARVVGSIVRSEKGDKIRVSRFKAKVRYRKTIGFRPHYSRVRIEQIRMTGETEEKKETEAVSGEKKRAVRKTGRTPRVRRTAAATPQPIS